MKSIVDQSHDFLKDVLHKGAICIDATLGWGKDTDFFLKNNVRKVYGFEIQQVVFEQTVSNIKDSHFVPVFDGHQNMDAYVKEEVDAITARIEPAYVLAGFATVTSFSIIIAGFFQNLL